MNKLNAILFLLALFASTAMSAQTYTWTDADPANSDMADPDNWTPVGTAIAGDALNILDTQLINPPVLDSEYSSGALLKRFYMSTNDSTQISEMTFNTGAYLFCEYGYFATGGGQATVNLNGDANFQFHRSITLGDLSNGGQCIVNINDDAIFQGRTRYNYWIYVYGDSIININGSGARLYGSQLEMESTGVINFNDGEMVWAGGNDRLDQTEVLLDYFAAGNIISLGGEGKLDISYTDGIATYVYPAARPGGTAKTAWDPMPADGDIAEPDINGDVILRWVNGFDPALSGDPNGMPVKHHVYFGTNEVDVTNASVGTPLGVYQGEQTVMKFNAGQLSSGTKYWRIDQEYKDGSTTKGDVWEFEVSASFELEGFETYSRNDDFVLAWVSPGDDVTLSPTVAYTGTQSMQFDYDTSVAPYQNSVTRTFTAPVDFVPDSAIKALTIYYLGDVANRRVAEVSVTLSDGSNSATVSWDYDSGQWDSGLWIKSSQWQEREMDFALSEFTDVAPALNLNAITSMTITIGDGVNHTSTPEIAGPGTIFIDHIMLNQSRCLGRAYDADFNGDCTANLDDIQLMAQDYNWLDGEGETTNIGAELVNGPGDDSQWVTGKINGALQLNAADGIDGDDWLDIDDSVVPNFHNKTLCFWLRIDDPNAGQFIFAGNSSYRLYLLYDIDSAKVTAQAGSTPIEGPALNKDQWYHIAVSSEENLTTGLADVRFYVNGNKIGTSNDGAVHYGPTLPGANLGSYNNGIQVADPGFIALGASFDDLRIYGYVLSDAEVAMIAAQTMDPVTGPLVHYTFDETTGDIANDTGSLAGTTIIHIDESEADVNDDYQVNFQDFAEFAQKWLEKVRWP